MHKSFLNQDRSPGTGGSSGLHRLVGDKIDLQVNEVGAWYARSRRLPECLGRGATINEALEDLGRTITILQENASSRGRYGRKRKPTVKKALIHRKEEDDQESSSRQQ